MAESQHGSGTPESLWETSTESLGIMASTYLSPHTILAQSLVAMLTFESLCWLILNELVNMQEFLNLNQGVASNGKKQEEAARS